MPARRRVGYLPQHAAFWHPDSVNSPVNRRCVKFGFVLAADTEVAPSPISVLMMQPRTPTFAITARLAETAEFDLVISILDEAARWLIARGIRQWESPPSAEFLAFMQKQFAEGEVYLIFPEGSEQAIGTFRLRWSGGPGRTQEANAGYLYSFALRPNYTGKGIGVAVIDWIGRQLAGLGRNTLRADCISGNQRLRNWYERLGFEPRGVVTDGPYQLALYELHLSGSGAVPIAAFNLG